VTGFVSDRMIHKPRKAKDQRRPGAGGRVRSDKYHTGIITIVPVRTAYGKFKKNTGNFEKDR